MAIRHDSTSCIGYSNNNGMYFTLAILFVNAAKIQNFIPMPMTNDGTDSHASQYVIESDFLTVFSTKKKLLSQDENNSCVGEIAW